MAQNRRHAMMSSRLACFITLARCAALVAPPGQHRTRPTTTLVNAASFEDAVRGALGADPAHLDEFLEPGATWRNPLGDYEGAGAVRGLLADAAGFLEAPRFDVYGEAANGRKTRYEWVASGGWPVQWAPRVVLHGASVVSWDNEGRAVDVVDEWRASPQKLVTDQIAPKFWDVYDLFATPTAERPGEETLDTVKLAGATARVVRTPPRLAMVASVVDVSNSRKQRVASALPDFCFRVDTRNPTRGSTTTAPLAISVEALPKSDGETTVRRKVTWRCPLPSRLGLDPADPRLPPLDGELLDPSLSTGVAVDPSLAYVLEPERYLLAAPFRGDVQDPAVDALRRELVAAAAASGLVPKPGPNGGAPPALLRKWQAKLGYTGDGACVYAVYANTPAFLPVDRDDVAIEIERP